MPRTIPAVLMTNSPPGISIQATTHKLISGPTATGGRRTSRRKQRSRRHTPTIPPSSFGDSHLRRESNCSDMVGPAQPTLASDRVRPTHRFPVGRIVFWATVQTRPVARTSITSPATTATTPIERATRSPAGSSRSSVIANVTNAIACRSIMPTTSKVAGWAVVALGIQCHWLAVRLDEGQWPAVPGAEGRQPTSDAARALQTSST